MPRKAVTFVKAASDGVDSNSFQSKSCGVGWDHIGYLILKRRTFYLFTKTELL